MTRSESGSSTTRYSLPIAVRPVKRNPRAPRSFSPQAVDSLIARFLLTRRAAARSPATLRYYSSTLDRFPSFCRRRGRADLGDLVLEWLASHNGRVARATFLSYARAV